MMKNHYADFLSSDQKVAGSGPAGRATCWTRTYRDSRREKRKVAFAVLLHDHCGRGWRRSRAALAESWPSSCAQRVTRSPDVKRRVGSAPGRPGEPEQVTTKNTPDSGLTVAPEELTSSSLMQPRRSCLGQGSALSRVLFLMLTCGASAGEKVTFTDKRSPHEPVTQSRPGTARVTIESPLGSFSPGSSSLRGIPAPPFSSPRPAPLTPQQREALDQRRDWIMQTPDDRLADSEKVNRALGVRDYSAEDAGKTAEEATENGTLLRFYEKLEAGESADLPAATGQASSEPTESLSPLGLDGAPTFPGAQPHAPSGEWSPAYGTPSSWNNGVPAGRLEPFRVPPRALGAMERPFEPRRGAESTSSFLRQVIAGTEGAPEPSGIERLLGGSPISSPIASPIVRSPITSLDPVTAYPDPTREALNPVVTSPIGSLNSPLQAGAATSPRSLLTTPSLMGRTLVGSESVGGSLKAGSRNDRGALQSIKVQLEMPRRSF